MMKTSMFMFLASGFFMAGCASAPFVVVEQPVVSSPIFTIIPFDGDTDFSRQVERDILALNLKVVERPELKFMSTDAQKTESSSVGSASVYRGGASSSGSGESVTASLYKVDVVAMYPEAKADYIVVTYSRSKEIRILKKSDLALIASGVYDGLIEMPKFIMSVLAHAGLIKSDILNKECKVVTRKVQ
jgi:hypothetical protein